MFILDVDDGEFVPIPDDDGSLEPLTPAQCAARGIRRILKGPPAPAPSGCGSVSGPGPTGGPLMPLSPDDLKARYDRLSFRFRAGTKAKLARLAERAEQSPTEWLEHMISRAFERDSRKDQKKG